MDDQHKKPDEPAALPKAGLRRRACLVPVVWILCIMVFLALWQFLAPPRPSAASFSDFMAQVRADPEKAPHVVEVSVLGREITYWATAPRTSATTKHPTTGAPPT